MERGSPTTTLRRVAHSSAVARDKPELVQPDGQWLGETAKRLMPFKMLIEGDADLNGRQNRVGSAPSHWGC